MYISRKNTAYKLGICLHFQQVCNGTARSPSKFIYTFWRNCHNVFQRQYIISNSHQQFIGLWFLAIIYYYLYFYHIYPNGHEWHLTVVLIYIYLMINGVHFIVAYLLSFGNFYLFSTIFQAQPIPTQTIYFTSSL